MEELLQTGLVKYILTLDGGEGYTLPRQKRQKGCREQ